MVTRGCVGVCGCVEGRGFGSDEWFACRGVAAVSGVRDGSGVLGWMPGVLEALMEEAIGMPTSRRSFDQVKGILAKLDRSIDTARERRLSDGSPGEEMIGRASDEEGMPVRAKPMRRASMFRSPVDRGAAVGDDWRPEQKG